MNADMFLSSGLAIPTAVSMIGRHAPATEDEFADTGYRADLYAFLTPRIRSARRWQR
jgi:hypothetical protein